MSQEQLAELEAETAALLADFRFLTPAELAELGARSATIRERIHFPRVALGGKSVCAYQGCGPQKRPKTYT